MDWEFFQFSNQMGMDFHYQLYPYLVSMKFQFYIDDEWIIYFIPFKSSKNDYGLYEPGPG